MNFMSRSDLFSIYLLEIYLILEWWINFDFKFWLEFDILQASGKYVTGSAYQIGISNTVSEIFNKTN